MPNMKPKLRGTGVHLVYEKTEAASWRVVMIAAKRATTLTSSFLKSYGLIISRQEAKRYGQKLYIHGRDGKIQRRESYYDKRKTNVDAS